MAAEGVYGVLGQPSKPVSFACAHCKAAFLVNTALKKSSAKCPRCRKTSVVNENQARNKALIYLCVGLFWLTAGITVTVGSVTIAKDTGGVFLIWFGAIILGVCYLRWAAIYACRTKTSHPVTQTPQQDMP